jgi:small subunit ribosomal protein S5
VVIGDENGQVGVGVAKADDVVNAFKKAKTDGRKKINKTSNYKIIKYST